MNCDAFLNSMQGTRPNLFSASTSSTSLNDNDNGFVEGTHNLNTKKVNPRSIKLFGKTIEVVEKDLHESRINGEDGSD